MGAKGGPGLGAAGVSGFSLIIQTWSRDFVHATYSVTEAPFLPQGAQSNRG